MPNKKALPVVTYLNIKHNIGNGKPTILTFGMSYCFGYYSSGDTAPAVTLSIGICFFE